MSRGLASAIVTEAEAERSALVVLVELDFWDGSSTTTTRFCTASEDIDAVVDGQSQTFTAAGGFVSWGGVVESDGESRDATKLTLGGVDQTIISTLLNNNFRGQQAQIWVAHLDETTGQIIDSPLNVFRGFLNEQWTVTENWGEERQPGTVEVSTSIVSRREALKQRRVKTNVNSHQQMLERAGLTTTDTFFDVLPTISGKEIFWNRDAPDEATSSGGGGGGITIERGDVGSF